MNWNDIRFFLAVARASSLTGAAKELQVNQSTVARRIASLEESLGAKLFLRRTDGYQLTEQGESLVEVSAEAEAHMRRIERAAAAPATAMIGTVRIALPELLGQHVLVPSFGGFLLDHPDIHLEFIADVRPEKLTIRRTDILLRLTQPEHGDYSIRRVGNIALGLYCSAGYVEHHGLPLRDADLAAHRLIGWEDHLNFMPMARWLIDKAPNNVPVIRTHSLSTQFVAAKAGMGIAVLPCAIARDHQMVRALPYEEPFRSGLWLLQHADTRLTARVEAAAEHIMKIIAAHAHALECAD